ncbi:MAG: sulfotransferase [Ahrensia sp.]|nr:sulfotransferase [Ahrensia sp.]
MPRLPMTVPAGLAGKRNMMDASGQKEVFRRGVELLARDKLSEAYGCFEAILRVNPNNIATLNNIGNASIRMGNHAQAVRFLENALSLSANNAETMVLLGSAYRENGSPDKAIEVIRKAIRLRPGNAAAHMNLALAYRDQGNGAQAVDELEKALQLDPESPVILCDLGQIHVELGQMDEAVRCFNEALRIDPGNVTALYGLSLAQKSSPQPGLLDLVRQRRTRDDTADKDRAVLLHAEGRILDVQGDHGEAMDSYVEAKRAAGGNFNINRTVAYYDALIKTFTPGFFEEQGKIGFDTKRPVFIVGMPRSGTTLVEQICASHPDVFGAGELVHVSAIANKLGLKPSTYTQFLHNVTTMKSKTAKELGKEYLGLAASNAAQETRILDKMPHNFEKLGLIATLLPEARIIHCERGALDTCVSIFMNALHEKHGYSSDLETLGLYYRQYHRLMEHWKSALPLRMLSVRYEDLIGDLEAGSRKMIDFLGLEWDDACLNFHETERTVRTLSRWQVRQPVYTSSVGRWKRYESRLGPLVAALGDLAEGD